MRSDGGDHRRSLRSACRRKQPRRAARPNCRCKLLRQRQRAGQYLGLHGRRRLHADLTNPDLFEVVAVALDKRGNCWASGIGNYPSYTPRLLYFKNCAGAGVVATNWHNSFYGGLDFDSDGNLVSLDLTFNTKGRVFVYSGCDPVCKIVGGPFALYDEAVYGHLNKNSTFFAAGDFQLGQVDIYNYASTQITYRYSLNNGLMYNLYPQGVTYSKRAH